MALEVEEDTIFVTERDLYGYKMIPFDLKNINTTYQHLVNKTFKHQIGQNIEIYVDDMLVKSTEKERHITDLEEIFEELRKHQIKLKPNKYAFEVISSKFFDFLIN